MNEKQSIKEASIALLACIENAEAFLKSAEILIQGDGYREAFLLTMYAAEEIGRILIIFNYPIHNRSADRLKKWRKRYVDHEEKFWFLRNIKEMERGIIPTGKREEDSSLKNKRLEICYVNYHDGKFQLPKTVTELEAKDFLNQIQKEHTRMKERHPSLQLVEKQLTEATALPEDPKKLKEILRDLGFKDS